MLSIVSPVHIFPELDEVQVMKVKFAPWLVAVSLALALPLCANAATVLYSFNLDGSQEVPPTGSPAAGSAQITIDDIADTIDFAVIAFNLLGSPVAAHIHIGPVGTLGPVVFDLAAVVDAAGPVTIGPIVIPSSLAFAGVGKGLSLGLGALINAAPSDFYVNIHTDLFPTGELRGQLAPVPVPAAVWLLGSALGGLGLMRRRAA